MTETPEQFTRAEVEKQLRMHRNTVLSHLQKGHFPGAWKTDPNGEWKIPQSAIDAFIARGTPTPG